VGITAVECPLADTGRAGDLLHRHGIDAALREQRSRRGEDAFPVLGRVAAFGADRFRAGIHPRRQVGHAGRTRIVGTRL
jgi:hypothetical protein